ncbi:methylated-DNA--[protein]-cysteine S-methyltransferase [Saccharopolyspora erythraea]|uniref:methylated-DNA--[protein]-cysteine S-methyltransferase n=1 Tax=Saccharopolyspora erythraea TaxID=1836 RepID=UPI001BAC704B|nr:methylated-DNA--[protein]-cysteine S-methyltransferase [Saccharopolyspora erythraea]QUH01611.1 methylated-DNA--[protein]-cysteine S-methyltransferase [Saccharopolyspora erythraea]
MRTELSWTAVRGPVGEVTAVAGEAGLVQVCFGGPEQVLPRYAEAVLVESGEPALRAGAQLEEYFAGRRREFDLPVDWSNVEGLRLQVLRTLHEQVPFGRTLSYRELARLAGRPEAARAVGTIMGSNPVPIVVPCHRVVASGGGLGGFGPGLEAKRRLLVLEGALDATLLELDMLA